jgi:hypothetical protein
MVNAPTQSPERRTLPARGELAETTRQWLLDAASSLARRASDARWSFVGTALLWFPLLLWFLGNRPGFFTFDSFDVWRQVTTGDWEDTHPIAYVAAMKISQVFVGTPTLLTIAQTVYVAAGLALLGRALVRAGCHRGLTYLVCATVASLPQVGGFAITLWKDIPYSAAMLCVAARVIDLFAVRIRRPGAVMPRWLLRSLFVHLLAAVLFRQNGVILAIFLGSMLLIVRSGRRRGVAVMTGALLLIFVTMKFALYPAIGVEHTPAEINIAGFVHDIDAALVKNPDLFTDEDLALLERAMPLSQWRRSYYCYAIINWYLNPSMRLTAFREDEQEYLALWRKVALHAPGTVISNRFCAASLAWRVDQSSSGYLYTLTYGVPDNAYGFKTVPVIDRFRPRMVKMLAWADEPHHLWFTWRAPAWIYLLDLVLVAQAVRFRRLAWLLPGAVTLAQQLNVIVLNPSQDARYMFGAYMVATASLALVFAARSTAAESELEAESDNGPGSSLEPGSENGPGSLLEPRSENGPGSSLEPGSENGPGSSLEPSRLRGPFIQRCSIRDIRWFHLRQRLVRV